jgi:hypothetical protein
VDVIAREQAISFSSLNTRDRMYYAYTIKSLRHSVYVV